MHKYFSIYLVTVVISVVQVDRIQNHLGKWLGMPVGDRLNYIN